MRKISAYGKLLRQNPLKQGGDELRGGLCLFCGKIKEGVRRFEEKRSGCAEKFAVGEAVFGF